MNSPNELLNVKRELLTLRMEQLRRLEAQKGKNDLIFLAEEILGYPKFGKIHQEIANFLERIVDKAVILLPRTHLKTTLITISWTIQQLIRNPDLRVFITNERLENSKSFLREIKAHFEKNNKFREVYGDWVNDEEKWTDTQIIIKPRQKNYKEPSIQVGSVDTSLVSQHYDLIIADDLVSRNNIGTREQILRVKQYWKDLISLLDTGGRLIDIGTRWHFDDLHGWLVDLGIPSIVKSCYGADGEPIFPEKFSKETLTKIKEEIGSYDFSCLYLNNPVDDENADFKLSWFQKIKASDLAGKTLNTYITIDTAISKKASADYTGIIINSVDREGNWYIRARRVKIDASELIRELFRLYAENHPVKIGIEKTIYLETLKSFLAEEQRKRGIYLPIVELEHKQTNKELRIRGLIPRYENKKIWHIEEECVELEDELLRFPKGQHDDLADALAYQLQIAEKPYRDEQDEIFRRNTIINLSTIR